jgi:hypothetical protein
MVKLNHLAFCVLALLPVAAIAQMPTASIAQNETSSGHPRGGGRNRKGHETVS